MRFKTLLLAVIVPLLAALAHAAPANPPPLILISMDAFRWDYCDLHPAETPNLRRLMRHGVSVRGLIPVFPSNTFTNHYTIVTGLYPAHHGMINNHMFDPTTGEFFRYMNPKSLRDPQWWGGEPIWITAVKQGLTSSCSYWPGSEAAIDGLHATDWKPFDYFDVTFEARLEIFIGWFKRPPPRKPAIATFYMEEANASGHDYGPDSPQLIETLKKLDTQLGTLESRLNAEGIEFNLVIVSDHGMAAVSPDRLLILDDYLDLSAVQIDHFGSTVGLRPNPGQFDAVEKSLRKMPHAKLYRAENLPERFHLKDHPRISPLWILPDEGWRVETRAAAQRPRASGVPLRGDHGYDPALLSMHGILIAKGPSFKDDGSVIERVENVHVYNLLCAATGLTPALNDGDDRLVRALLK